MLAWLIGAALTFAAASGLSTLIATITLASFPPVIGALASTTLTALALKPLFAWRMLRNAVIAVATADDLPAMRKLLSWHLVSRDTSELTEAEVCGATIESLTENLSDSLVAPLLCFAVGGLPLAALYRFANNADAMWGYRTPALERFGKWAARADDLLNLIPARLTALLLILATALARLDMRSAWRVWRRDARATPSPNAGHPMSAAAGALQIHLTKRGVYSLGAGFRDPNKADIARALRWATIVAWCSALSFTAFGIRSVMSYL
jgi:adenosylcobinamide-phosphate synthase